MVGWILREITDEFVAAGIRCDYSYQPVVHGQRRTLIEQHYATVDWTDQEQIGQILQIYENVLHRVEANASDANVSTQAQDQHKTSRGTLIRFLEKDGFSWVEGRIVSSQGVPSLASFKKTTATFDAQHLADQIRRMESAVESDPSLAIGTAKELIETTCKTILAERGKPIPGTPDMVQLTKATLKELKLVPEGIPDAARGSDVIKRLLSNLGTIGNGLAELRGLYGTGHGRHGRTQGLVVRHAKLAVGVAATLAEFLFQTHKETSP